MMSRKTAVILFLAACAAIAAPPTLAAPERRRAETVSRRTHGTRRILKDKDGDGIDDYNARITSTTFCKLAVLVVRISKLDPETLRSLSVRRGSSPTISLATVRAMN